MTTTVRLTEAQAAYLAEKIEDGTFASADEMVAAALTQLQERDDVAKLEWLRQAYAEGVASGVAGPLDLERIRAEGRRLLAEG